MTSCGFKNDTPKIESDPIFSCIFSHFFLSISCSGFLLCSYAHLGDTEIC